MEEGEERERDRGKNENIKADNSHTALYIRTYIHTYMYVHMHRKLKVNVTTKRAKYRMHSMSCDRKHISYSKAALSWAKTIYYKYIVLAQLNAALL